MRVALAALVIAGGGLTGCATAVTGPLQVVTVKTMTGQRDVSGAVCTLRNNHGEWQVTSPGMVRVRRSYDDMNIRCESPGYVSNAGSVPSETREVFFGNVFAGGMVGAAVDIGVGSGFGYPSPIVVNLQPVRPQSLAARRD